MSHLPTKISHNDVVTPTAGKRAGARKGAKSTTGFQPLSLLLALGAAAAVITWAGLVYLTILRGQDLRAGDGSAWRMVAVTGTSAVISLFLGFLLAARLLRLLGVTTAPEKTPAEAIEPGVGRRIRSQD